MSVENKVIENLKKNGERITEVRRIMIEFFFRKNAPLSALDIQTELERRGHKSNKTTVYRQLATLLKYNLLHEVRLRDRTLRYELTTENDHHHHLVCVRCKKITDINFKDDLDRQEKIIAQKKKFKVTHHSLEFFGLCSDCQKKKSIKL